MMDKIRVFLSSAMDSTEWRLEREALIALFEQSALGMLCELTFIEGETGQGPQAIYTHKLRDAHLVLLLLADELRPGVEDEILKAIVDKKPILVFEKTGVKPQEPLRKFKDSYLHEFTTVQSYSSLSDLLSKIRSAIIGLLTRSLATVISTDKFVRDRATQLVKEGAAKEEKLAFARFVASAGRIHHAIGFLKQEYEAKTYDQDLELAYGAASLLELKGLPEELVGRLKYASSRRDQADWLLAFHHLFRGEFDTAQGMIPSLKPGELAQALVRIISYLSELQNFEGDESDYVDTLKQRPEDDILTLESLKIAGFSPATNLKHFIRQDEQSIPVELSESILEKAKFEHCPTCLPYDSGEPVEIYPKLGDLRDLVNEALYNEYPEIEWCDVTLEEPNVNCPGCGATVELNTEVYDGDYDVL